MSPRQNTSKSLKVGHLKWGVDKETLIVHKEKL